MVRKQAVLAEERLTDTKKFVSQMNIYKDLDVYQAGIFLVAPGGTGYGIDLVTGHLITLRNHFPTAVER